MKGFEGFPWVSFEFMSKKVFPKGFALSFREVFEVVAVDVIAALFYGMMGGLVELEGWRWELKVS